MSSIPVAIASCECRCGELAENLVQVKTLAARASGAGAAMLVFPEMNLTGYATDPLDVARVAIAVSEVEGALAAISDKTGVGLLVGLVERGEGGRFYASHLVVEPCGITGVYRKTHLGPPERELFTAGDTVPVFDVAGIRFGIQLCYDAHFPELSTHMALQGAELIVIPHASPRGTPDEKRDSWLRHLTARAFDTGSYVMAVNPVGCCCRDNRYPGVILVIGPDGRVLLERTFDLPEFAVVSIEPQRVARARSHRMTDYLSARRPELYRRLAGSRRS